jgi:hypothetical protein
LFQTGDAQRTSFATLFGDFVNRAMLRSAYAGLERMIGYTDDRLDRGGGVTFVRIAIRPEQHFDELPLYGQK